MYHIATSQFGYLMYAASLAGAGFSDQISEAYLYDHRDDKDAKLAYWRAIAKYYGFDPLAVQVIEAR